MAKNLLQASEGRLRKGSISVNISLCPQKYIIYHHVFLVVLRMQTIQMFKFGLEFRSRIQDPIQFHAFSCCFWALESFWQMPRTRTASLQWSLISARKARQRPRGSLVNKYYPLVIKRGWKTSHLIWLVVRNMFYFAKYMGCHPSHWRTHIFQDG